MLTQSLCRRIQGQLSAYLDGELPVAQHIEVRQHLWRCARCRSECEELEAIGAAVRGADRGGDASLDGLADRVVSRVLAEERESWPAQLQRAFDDMHLVWAGLSATAAVVVCAGLAATVVAVGPRAERADSLRALVTAVAAQGTDRQPVLLTQGLQAPRVSSEALTPFMLAMVVPAGMDADSESTFSAVVTREGRVEQARLVEGQPDAGFMESLEASARFEPASRGGVPVAVSLVWHVSHTTVRPISPAELIKPQSGRLQPGHSST